MADLLKGKWSYRSFRNGPITVSDGKVSGAPELAVPWAPPGELEVCTDGAGKVSGTLTFRPGIALTITGSITPATGQSPAEVDLTGEGLSAVYRLRGWFISGNGPIVGTVVCMANDLAKQPVGTAGPFVLASTGV